MRKIYLILRDFSKQLVRDNISAYASSTAFFFFLSIVPILLVVSTIVTFTPLSKDDMLQFMGQVLPEALTGTFTRFINQIYDKAHTILPIALVVAIWSAGKGMMGLQMGLNVAHGVV
ncbi:MAG: YihY/virulence factor BrkB family protein, partial [Lachnospiraceae bacterium]|nr:YihY/virulence factor BrkB family protein [Lachnospiraceae bacterium]